MNAKKITLCVIIPTHWEALMGGSQYQAKLLIDRLHELGTHEIYYLTRWVNPDFVSRRYQIIRIGKHTGIGRYGHFVDTFRLLKNLREIKPDVIY